MTDSKTSDTAQYSTDHNLVEKEVNVLGRSEPERSSAERSRKLHPDVTRYGDWEKNGRCIDF